MNYLSVPRMTQGNKVSSQQENISNQPFLPKDSFMSNSQQQISSYQLLPPNDSQQNHTLSLNFNEEKMSIKKQLEELKQTVAEFHKSLQEAKFGQQMITEKTQISNVIRSLFNSLKQIIKSNRNSEDFDWVFKNYIEVLRRKQNSQHFFTQVSGHLKQILSSSELQKLKRNRKIFIFLERLFKQCPHTIYKTLQNKTEIFDNETSQQALKVYKEFIRRASQKSSNTVISGYIKNELAKQSPSIDKLIILLSFYKGELQLQTIEIIEKKIDKLLQNFIKKDTLILERQLIELINKFLSMDWPSSVKKHKTIIKYVNHWALQLSQNNQKTINKFLKNMPLIQQQKTHQQIKDTLYAYIMNRLLMINAKVQKSLQSRRVHNKDFDQTFLFLTILFDRCGKNIIESIIQKNYFKKTVQNLISEPFPLKDGLINMLSTLKKLNVHDEGNRIQTLLIEKMITILSDQKCTNTTRYSEVFQKQMRKIEQNTVQNRTENDIVYCIKALRYFSFNYESFWSIYSMIKRYIFKRKIINQYGFQFKKQVLKSCLHIIRKLQKPQQCKNILNDALYIIGQQQELKAIYIEWVEQNKAFYDKKIFEVYNSSEEFQNLIHDYSSKNINIKRFSIKMLCLLYPYNQCEIIPFLKKTYYQIYERLSVSDLVEAKQKITGLKLVREIIKQRSQIVKDDSPQFAAFLYNELCQLIKTTYQHHSDVPQNNQLMIEILKTIISMLKIMKQAILPYVRSLGFHLISLINSKVTGPDIKKYCLETFKQMTFYCGYVILPYFYHRNLLTIFRQIIKTDDRNEVYRHSLMRLIGSFGYVSKQKFFRLKKITDHVQQGGISSAECYLFVETHFQKVFKEINYLKQMKLYQRIPKQFRDIRESFRQGRQKDMKQLRETREIRETKLALYESRQQKQFKQVKQIRQIKQIKPFPATSPYYTQEKVNYKASKQNFNYKKMIIEKVLQNMNQQSSSIIFYNTFKTLESFIFILPKTQEKMYQDLVFSKISLLNKKNFMEEKKIECKLYVQKSNDERMNTTSQVIHQQSESYPFNNVLPLLVKIIFYQDFKQYISELFDFFTSHLENQEKRTLILECLFVLTSRDSEIIEFKVKQFILSMRKLILQLFNTLQSSKKQLNLTSSINFDEVQHHILISFGILTNLSKYLDNYLHLLLPDFNMIFIKRPQKICQTYFCLLLKVFQNCPSAQQFLSQISDHMFTLLKSQLQGVQTLKKSQATQHKGFTVVSQNSRSGIISFINNIIDFLISILLIFGDKFKGFSESFHKIIRLNNYKSHIFYNVVDDFMKKNSSFHNLHYFFQKNQLTEIMKFQRMHLTLKTRQDSIIKNIYKHESVLNFNILFEMIENFNCDQNQVEEQSQEWFMMLSISIFQKSEDPFIRACLPIVKEDKTLCNDLFPMAFYFFWNILNNEFRRRLTMKLKNILINKGVSLKVKQKFIDMIYFMQQQQFPIPIPDKILRDTSQQVLDLAKSLFYMQKLFLDDPEVQGQSLIKMYAQMGQSESAVGLLSIVPNLTIRTKIQLYQKLNRYREALRQHENLKEKSKPQNIELEIKIRKDMFEWQSVLNRCQKLDKHKNKISHYAVQSAINLGKWDHAKKHIANVDSNHEKYNLWKAMLSINDKKYQEVEKYIRRDRQLIYPKICQLFNFSYERKMEGVIRLQTLTELEEANEYLKVDRVQGMTQEEKKKYQFSTARKKALIDGVWNDRIQGANTNLWSMQQLLVNRSLLLSKTDDIDNWISYCKLALKQNQPELCKKTLQALANELKDPRYNVMKQSKERRKNEFIIETLLVECQFLLGDLRDQEAVTQIQKLIQQKGTSGSHHEYFYKCANWLAEKQYDFTIQKAKKSISLLNNAVKDFKTYIKGWHFLGLMHNRIIEMSQEKKKNQPNIITSKPSERRISTLLSSSKQIDQSQLVNLNTTRTGKDKDSRQHDSREILKQTKQQKEKDLRQFHISQALRCFIQSVKCGVKNHQYFLQDCLKIMNIIFTQYDVEGVLNDLLQEYQHIPSEGLIDIIPQIVGRLDIADKPMLLEMMKKLLVHIGISHPQAIIFPLIFCKKSGNYTKKRAAEEIFSEISKKQKSYYSRIERDEGISEILKDAQKITEQLIKVSLKLNQKFYINVYKIYRQSIDKCVCSRSIAAAYCTFIQKMMEEDSTGFSFSQYGFIQQYRQQFREIRRKLMGYIELGQTQLFKKAQQKIKTILEDIRASLEGINKVYLEEVSPDLFNMKHSKVCLFGEYNPSTEPIYITSFQNQLKIVLSKQRPKKIVVKGSNQKEYNFLLKGKQDLRLDERIMQLFSLINKMFYDPSERQNYSIKGYSITPISLQIGIISWVQNCDTIGELIIKSRSSSNVYLEKQLSRQICQVYQILPKAQKVQIYKQIEQRVSGTDLKNIFWTRSSSSEQWLKTRTCYTRSLAVMSIVGYVIGLGDRHPNNIMIQRDTGQIVHIDFGDCFDVNKMRKQYPEKVPFRLTRMLVKAMEPCGVHGIFKHTCEKIIKLLRNNKESIIAIVQAFRYDPLIGWRLVKNDEASEDQGMLEHSFSDNDISFITKAGQKLQGDEKHKKEERKTNKNIDFALHILNEIKKKLNGRFTEDLSKVLSPQEQVQRLINEATSPQNLVEHYEGWQIYW